MKKYEKNILDQRHLCFLIFWPNYSNLVVIYLIFGNVKRGRSAVTLGGAVAAGIEMGDPSTSIFSFSIGYRLAYLFKELVDEQNFNAIFIRLGMVTHF